MSDRNDRQYWAKVPREVILRAMAPDQCLDSRLRHAMILWSWCGPEMSDSVVRKDAKGFIRKDDAGEPITATLRDLCKLLGMAPGMNGHISRAAQALESQKLVRFEGRVMYLVPDPPKFEEDGKVAMHGNFHIAGVAVHGNQLPADPVARQEAIAWLEEAHARYKTERNELNARWRGLLRTALSARGILIDEKKKSYEMSTGGRNLSATSTATATAAAARPPDSILKPLKTWLVATFDVPTHLDDEILARVAAHIPDDAAFHQFQKAAAEARPKKWGLFERIAEQCAARRAEAGERVILDDSDRSRRIRMYAEELTKAYDAEHMAQLERDLEACDPEEVAAARKLAAAHAHAAR